jgi:twitching motility protein PilT
MDDKAAAALLDTLLARCLETEASDLHLSPGLPPGLRVHGDLRPMEGQPVVTPEFCAALHRHIAGDQTFEAKGSIDGAMNDSRGVRFRYNIFKRGGHVALVIRRLEDTFRTLAQLGLPESLSSLCDLRDGLVIVSGATGAGKSTTLATMIDRINQRRRSHIVTIEDPIEYIHQPRMSYVSQRQIGPDAPSFNDALVASLRQDPDVILVGEIRDLDTIRTAITAAETGHLVFTTLHAGDCASSIERLVSVFPADEQDGIRRQLSLVLRAIIAQHLLPAIGEGRERVAASEVLMVTPAIANLTATAKSAQIYSAMETGQAQGMQTLEQDLARLVVAGKIAEFVAVATSRNPNVMRDRVALLRTRGNGGVAAGVRR